jgi:hypothetical protein
MNLWAEFDSRARRLGIVDTKLAQGAAIFLVLTLVKIFPEILSINILWFIGLCVLCAIKPVMTFYGPGGGNHPH